MVLKIQFSKPYTYFIWLIRILYFHGILKPKHFKEFLKNEIFISEAFNFVNLTHQGYCDRKFYTDDFLWMIYQEYNPKCRDNMGKIILDEDGSPLSGHKMFSA